MSIHLRGSGAIPDRIVRTYPLQELQAAVNRAAEILSAGGLIAYPTESFYGLAVDVTNETAIRRLFLAKRRQPGRPVLILIASVEILDQYAERISSIAWKLIEAFWPGGLTLVFEAGPRISPLLTGGTGKIGIRLSSHPVATALTRALGAPISGTSANISGEPPCRSAEEIMRSFGKDVDLILDGGKTPGEIGSTILDMTVEPPRILREGMVDRRELEKLIHVQAYDSL